MKNSPNDAPRCGVLRSTEAAPSARGDERRHDDEPAEAHCVDESRADAPSAPRDDPLGLGGKTDEDFVGASSSNACVDTRDDRGDGSPNEPRVETRGRGGKTGGADASVTADKDARVAEVAGKVCDECEGEGEGEGAARSPARRRASSEGLGLRLGPSGGGRSCLVLGLTGMASAFASVMAAA